jgi:hypothetical protein
VILGGGNRLRVLIVVAAALAASFASLWNRFTYDDLFIIAEGTPQSAHSVAALFGSKYFALSEEATFRPMVTLSYVLDFQIAGLSPWVYHLQSVLWHALSAALVYAFARRLLPPSPAWPALVAGVLFAVHPVLTEAVSNVSFREDPMVTALGLIAILLAFRGGAATVSAFVFYALALFAKESAVVVPLLWYVADRFLLPQPSSSRRSIRLVGFVVVTALWVWVRFRLLILPGAYAVYPDDGFLAAMVELPRLLMHYLRLVIWPSHLCADYRGTYTFPWPNAIGWISGAGYATILGVGFAFAARRDRYVAFGLAWFIVALTPTLNILPMPVPVAERFLYLPLVGIALAVAAATARVAPKLVTRRSKQVAVAAFATVALGGVIASNLRHRVWHDDVSLWAETTRDYPQAYGAFAGLGGELWRRGDRLGAAAAFRRGLELDGPLSQHVFVEKTLTQLLLKQDLRDEAIVVLHHMLAEDGFNPDTAWEVGELSFDAGDVPGGGRAFALCALMTGGKVRPDVMAARADLATGDIDGAIAWWQWARKQAPTYVDVVDLEAKLREAAPAKMAGLRETRSQ